MMIETLVRLTCLVESLADISQDLPSYLTCARAIASAGTLQEST
jgi:hypothetical protein